MDTKVTLSFDQATIEKAKAYASSQGLSLSRMMEIMLQRLIDNSQYSLENYPVSDWVTIVSEGPAEYRKANESLKKNRTEAYKKSRRKNPS
jgi:hypothetical protein